MRAVCAGWLFVLALGCTSDPEQREDYGQITVVWVEGALPVGPAAFDGLGSLGTVRASVALCGVPTLDDARRLLATLRARGDSVIIGLGRPILPALRDAKGCARLWVGYDSPGTVADAQWEAWWAPADSLRAEVARLAVRCPQSQVVLVGSSVGPEMLRILQDSHARILPVNIGSGMPRGLLPAPDDVVLMVDAAPLPDGVWDRVYWVCESPFQAAPKARVEICMDWRAAIISAIQWHLSRGGVPPGPTLGPRLTLRTAGEDS